MGLQRETASRGSTGMYAQALFAVVLEGIFLRVIPSSLSVLGATIIISSAICVVVSGHLHVACCGPLLIPPLAAGKAKAVDRLPEAGPRRFSFWKI
jgi:hypothetical protein